jgi:hypothetical protein
MTEGKQIDINTVFTRELLKRVHAEVKAAHPAINLRAAAWVWHDGHRHWEFHGPGEFYWSGRAYNAYEARAYGWMAWLERHPARENEMRVEAIIATPTA